MLDAGSAHPPTEKPQITQIEQIEPHASRAWHPHDKSKCDAYNLANDPHVIMPASRPRLIAAADCCCRWRSRGYHIDSANAANPPEFSP